MSHETSKLRSLLKRNLLGRALMMSVVLAAFAVPAYSQFGGDAFSAGDTGAGRTHKVFDASDHEIGKAEISRQRGKVANFGYSIALWLDDGARVRVLEPQSGSRSEMVNCSLKEYTVDARNRRDTTLWKEVGSGTAYLKMAPRGLVTEISVEMSLKNETIAQTASAAGKLAKSSKFVIKLH